jgi:hypothetical protein
MIDQAQIEKFRALFKGNDRSYGVYMPNAVMKMMTVKSAITAEHVRSHLEGGQGLGAVPIMDDNKCWFAAIDIDVHGPAGGVVDIVQIEQKVTRNQLPLMVCRSKSGGAHCYAFFKQPADAGMVRAVLGRWAAIVGHGSAEIFPKQTNLDKQPGEAERPLGNWINLPYFKAAESDRWCMDGGKEVTFEYFLELAEARRTDLKEHDRGQEADYVQGPPCLNAMVQNKVDSGSRNTAAFQAAVYLKRAFPDDWRARLDGFNRVAFSDPLNPREVRTIAGSINKKDYHYKCREEPCKSLCNRDVCKTREFGITDRDDTANEIPLIDEVVKVIATPIRWELTIKGQKVELTTERLFNYDLVRQAVGEKLHIILPRIKSQEWDLYLTEIMTKVKVRTEMTVDDLIFMRLCEYLKRIRADRERPEDERREDLRRGIPALISISTMGFVHGKVEETKPKDWYYAFRANDFIEYLKRKKALPVQEHQIPTILHRVLGEDSKRDKMRVGKDKKISNVWTVPESSIEDEAVPEKDIAPEF